MRRLGQYLTTSLWICLPLYAQDPADPPTYRLTETYIKELARQNSLLFELPVRIEGRTANVHQPAGDCEMHLAGSSSIKIGFPGKVVVEPPNLCRYKPPAALGSSWGPVFDAYVLKKSCVAVGFPRLFAEHIKNGKPPANPPHMVEVHPALELRCTGSPTISFSSFLTIVKGMGAILDESADQCIEGYKLWVRQNGSNYEFLEDRPGRCGNFVVFDAVVDPQYVRKVAGGHSAIAQVWAVESRPHSMKLYTYDGTKEDTDIASIGSSANEEPTEALPLHGLLTVDYFSVLRVLRDRNGNWISVPEWTPVRFPLAVVVYGRAK